MTATIQAKKQTIRRPITLLFAFVGLATSAAIILFASIISDTRAQTIKVKVVTWNITGKMINPLSPGDDWYRIEDPETKIVCYTGYKDFSGGLSCAKK